MRVFFLDEDIDVETTVNALRRRHPEHDFVLAIDLADAKTHLWKSTFDVLVVDLWLPPDEVTLPNSGQEGGILAGFALLDAVASDKNCPNHGKPYLVFSGLVSDEHPRIRQFKTEHPDRFLKKPVHPDILFDSIQRIASTKKA